MSDEMRCEALLIGLNYVSESRMRLNGCWNDAIGLHSLLTAEPYSFDPEKVYTITDMSRGDIPKCTKSAISRSLLELARRSYSENLDIAVVSYSGHGSRQRDYSGDEADGMDEGICPIDCMRRGLLIDDDLHNIFMQFNPATRVYAVFDCCHSGTVLDLPYCYRGAEGTEKRTLSPAEVGRKITMISGCRDTQTSADAWDRKKRQFGGALTMALLEVLHQEEAPVGACELHDRVLAILRRQGHSQYPVISSTEPITDDCKFFV